jgi:hypothetical protein
VRRAPTHEEQADALEGVLADDDRKLLDGLAEGIARRGLATVGILFLESARPLGFVASQVMHFFRPLVAAFADEPDRYDRLTRILERRGAVELLVRRLEARA